MKSKRIQKKKRKWICNRPISDYYNEEVLAITAFSRQESFEGLILFKHREESWMTNLPLYAIE
nr:hypothetical protein [uncultured Bacteroides sp.]